MPKGFLSSVKMQSVPHVKVEKTLRHWANTFAATNSQALQVGYFGSYACGDFNPSSDLDAIIVFLHSDKPRHLRPLDFDLRNAPVDCEVFVYTKDELARPILPSSLVANILTETRWIFDKTSSQALL